VPPQISLHGFNLAQWVDDNGVEAYKQMLETIGELVRAGNLRLSTNDVPVASLDAPTLRATLASHTAAPAGGVRARSVIVFGDEATTNEVLYICIYMYVCIYIYIHTYIYM